MGCVSSNNQRNTNTKSRSQANLAKIVLEEHPHDCEEGGRDTNYLEQHYEVALPLNKNTHELKDLQAQPTA